MTAHPERMERLGDRSLDEAIGQILGEVQLDDGLAPLPWADGDGPPTDDDEDWGAVSVWWVNRLGSADTGLADRMAWIWHNWFTVSDEAFSGPKLAADLIDILYRHGLGDLRTLVHKVITSGAMLRYLDAAGSQAYNPNENLARELMELYTIGPEHYDENDVRAAARALAGWDVEDEEGTVWFDPGNAFVAPLIFMGVQDEWTTEKLIDTLVDHPGTAHRVTARLWRDLVGSELTAEQARTMGDRWRNDGLQILDLVESILRSDEFAESAHQRYCTALEWMVSVLAIVDPDGDEVPLEPWHLENMGQRPLSPPSPAGWPNGQFWARPGSLLPRLQGVQDLDTSVISGRAWSSADILATAGLPADDPVGPLIERVLTTEDFEDDDRRRVAWRIALTCPTFQRH